MHLEQLSFQQSGSILASIMRYLNVNRSLELQNVRKRQAEAHLRTDSDKKSADTDSHIHPDMHTHKHKHTVSKDDPENRQSF